MSRDIDWDHLAETLGPRLFSYFKRRNCSNEAADLTQETLLRLFDKVQEGSFQESRGSLSQLSFGIARLVWLEHTKDLKSFTEIKENDLLSNHSLEEQTQNQQVKTLVRRFVDELSPAQQEVLHLVLDQELTISDISKILGLPEGTIKSHIHRAKELLRSNLNEVWEHL